MVVPARFASSFLALHVLAGCSSTAEGVRNDAAAPDATAADASPADAAQDAPPVVPTVLNGSFETTTLNATCHSDLSNTAFTAAVANVTAFGAFNQLDLYVANCFGSTTTDGVFHVGIAANATSDALALALSAPLTPGARYRVRFSAHHGNTGGATSTIVELGTSTTPTDFGSLAGATGLLPAIDTEQSLDFTAPTAATHITLRVQLDGDLGWAMLDNIRIELAS